MSVECARCARAALVFDMALQALRVEAIELLDETLAGLEEEEISLLGLLTKGADRVRAMIQADMQARQAAAKRERETEAAAEKAAKEAAMAKVKADKEAAKAAAKAEAEARKATEEANAAIAREKAKEAAEAKQAQEAAAKREREKEAAAEKAAKEAAMAKAKADKEAGKAAAKAEAEARKAMEEANAAIAREMAKGEADAKARARAEAVAKSKAEKEAERQAAEEARQRMEVARADAKDKAKEERAAAEAARAEVAAKAKTAKEEEKRLACEEAARRKAEAEAAKLDAERQKLEAAIIARQEIMAREEADREKEASSSEGGSPRGSTASSTAQARLERAQTRFPGLRRRSESGIEEKQSGSAPQPRASSLRRRSEGGDSGSGSYSLWSAVGGSNAQQGNTATGRESSSLGEMVAEPELLQQSEAKAASKWLKSWRSGAARSAEMDAVVNFSGDCLADDVDGDSLACIGGDGDGSSVSIYSVKRGAVVQNLHGHTDLVCCVAIQGDVVVSAGRDRLIRIWSRKKGTCTATLEGSEDAIYALALRGDQLLSGEGSPKGGKVRLWEVHTKALRVTGSDHAGPVWSVAFGRAVAVSASHDHSARVWELDAAAGAASKSRANLEHPIYVFSVSVEGDLAATGCGDGKVRLWSLTNFTCVRMISHGSGARPSRGYYASLIGGVLLSAGDETLKIWDIECAEPECVATLSHGANVKGIAAARAAGKGSYIASVGGESKKLVIWRAA